MNRFAPVIFFMMLITALFASAQVPELYPYRQNGMYGYIDGKNVEKIKFTFEEAHPFSEGKAFVKNGKWRGYIRSNGTWVYYDTLANHGEKMEKGVAIIKRTKGTGAIDSTGKIIIPFDYLFINRYDPLNVFLAHKDLQVEGETLPRRVVHLYTFAGLKVPVDFDKAITQEDACALGMRQGDKLWVYGKDGKPLLNYAVDDIFANKFGARIKIKDSYGIINRYGKLVLPVQYKRVWVSEWAPYADFHNAAGDTSAYLDLDNGRIAFKFNGILSQPACDGVVVISYINNVHNVLDMNGNRITQLITYEDTARARQRDYIAALQHMHYTEGLIGIRHADKKWYAYNKLGRLAFQKGYEANFYFGHGVAIVRTNGYSFEWGMIDRNGKEILPLIYRDVMRTHEPNVVKVIDKENREGLFYTDGRVALPLSNKHITEYHDGFFLIKGDYTEKYNAYGYVNTRTGMVYFNQNAQP